LWKLGFPIANNSTTTWTSGTGTNEKEAIATVETTSVHHHHHHHPPDKTVENVGGAMATTNSLTNGASSNATATTTSSCTQISFLCALHRHDGPVNAAAFSPNQQHLATGGETGSVILWTLPNESFRNGIHDWSRVTKEADLAVSIVPIPSGGTSVAASAITDLSWCPSGTRLAVSTMAGAVVILEQRNNNSSNSNSTATASSTSGGSNSASWSVASRHVALHSHYAQGVAYDPHQVYLASQGSDRTVRILQRKKASVVNNTSTTTTSTSTVSAKKILQPHNPHVAPKPPPPPPPPLSAVTATLGERSPAATTSTATNNTNTTTAMVGTSIDNDVAADNATTPAFPVRLLLPHQADLDAPQQQGGTLATAEPQRRLAQGLTQSKLEWIAKTKVIKYRTMTSSSSSNSSNSTSSPGQDAEMAKETGPESEPITAPTATTTTNTTNNRHYWYEGETLLKSFVRRLTWTVDGAYLITPAAIWNTNESKQSSSYATLLFQRHALDEPCKVLAGLEKVSSVG
jgi:WD40 repeat protein